MRHRLFCVEIRATGAGEVTAAPDIGILVEADKVPADPTLGTLLDADEPSLGPNIEEPAEADVPNVNVLAVDDVAGTGSDEDTTIPDVTPDFLSSALSDPKAPKIGTIGSTGDIDLAKEKRNYGTILAIWK